MNNKAISPLIATVLIIALAVAIGAVIMAYVGTLGECSSVEFTVPKEKGVPEICIDAEKDMLKLTLENGEKQDIEMFKLTLHGSTDISNIELEEALGATETKRFTLPYNKKGIGVVEKIKIVPTIKKDNTLVNCPADKGLIIENIPDCSSVLK